MVSKDVQKVANKRLIEDENFSNTHIQAVQLRPTWMISKSVNNISKDDYDKVNEKGNIVSKGTPDWVISKGVHQTRKK